jgi:hypothetical protein
MMRKPYFFQILPGLEDGPWDGPLVKIVDTKGHTALVLSCDNKRRTGEREWFYHHPHPSRKQRQAITRLSPDSDGRVRNSSRHQPRSRAVITWFGLDYCEISFAGGWTVRHYVLLPALEKRVAHLGAGDTLTLTIDEIRACISS